ncbi:MAG: flagellar motor switch protein FliN [Acidobacteria bacterium]|nr:flagellar motor switch protein FliN [Acidobacteriota bacterium]
MTDPIQQWLAGELAESFAGILESMTEERPRISCEAADAPPEGDLLWWEQPLSIGPDAIIWIGAPRQSVTELGSRALRAAGIDTAEAGEARDTYVEILNQVLSGIAQAIGARMQREVVCAKGTEIQAIPSISDGFSFEVSYPDSGLPRIFAAFGAELIRAVQNAESAAEGGRQPVPVPDPAMSVPDGQPSKTLDLLLEVEMPVSISFGRAELPLKDVLKLTSGSIIELNRSVSEPVDVIVNNCVVARGEVVVMDGNYGVKIHRIVSAQERLRTLK